MDGSEPTHRRRHGCHTPFKAEQLAGAACWAALVAGCYGLIIPMARFGDRSGLAAAAAVYTGLVAAVVALHLMTSMLDPQDLEGSDDMPDGAEEGTWLCQTCKKYVRSGTKHCAACAKCVARFDHHCVWLNTCIGGRNYAPFFALLNAVVALLAAEAAAGVAVLGRSLARRREFDAALLGAYPTHIHPWGYRATLAAVVVAALFVLSSVGGLWAMHWVLLAKGATTWDMVRAHLAQSWVRGSRRTSRNSESSGAEAAQTAGGGATGDWVVLGPPVPCCGDSRVAPAAVADERQGLADSAGTPGRHSRPRVPISPLSAIRIHHASGSVGSNGGGGSSGRGCGSGSGSPHCGTGDDASTAEGHGRSGDGGGTRSGSAWEPRGVGSSIQRGLMAYKSCSVAPEDAAGFDAASGLRAPPARAPPGAPVGARGSAAGPPAVWPLPVAHLVAGHSLRSPWTGGVRFIETVEKV